MKNKDRRQHLPEALVRASASYSTDTLYVLSANRSTPSGSVFRQVIHKSCNEWELASATFFAPLMLAYSAGHVGASRRVVRESFSGGQAQSGNPVLPGYFKRLAARLLQGVGPPLFSIPVRGPCPADQHVFQDIAHDQRTDGQDL